jgi:hypothetical protein
MRIEDLTIDQLLELNDHICRRIDELRRQADFQVLMKLRLGQQVHFEGPNGRVFGVVIKMNRKTIVVQTEDRRQWKIPAGLVSPIKDCN